MSVGDVGDILCSIKTLTISGKDENDVPVYLEKQLAKLLTELEELREDEDS
ncbi:MAG: hypothetical protein V7K48_24160 [Nostoc sp.]|uniref:hypothetical protein n=1 Tax=Nostoc sp. TaxID=1180 RepID=UPI002FFCA936